MSTVSIVGLACLGVLLYDAVAALLSRTTPIPYAWFAPGSFVIYLAAGYFVGDAATGAAAAAVAAAVDATLGSVIARGLQARFDDSFTKGVEAGAATFVITAGALLGAAGRWLA